MQHGIREEEVWGLNWFQHLNLSVKGFFCCCYQNKQTNNKKTIAFLETILKEREGERGGEGEGAEMN